MILSGDNNGFEIDDEALLVVYRKPEVVHPTENINDDSDLSDYVKIRLVLARMKALAKFEEIQKLKEEAA